VWVARVSLVSSRASRKTGPPEMICADLRRIRSVVSPIAAEDEFRNASESDGANDCYRANRVPPGRPKRQNSQTISERTNGANDEKWACEAAVNAPAPGNVEQTCCAHETERRRPQNSSQSRRCAKAQREGEPWDTPKKTRAWPT